MGIIGTILIGLIQSASSRACCTPARTAWIIMTFAARHRRPGRQLVATTAARRRHPSRRRGRGFHRRGHRRVGDPFVVTRLKK